MTTISETINKIKKWTCDHLGWHRVDIVTEFDGISMHGNCKICGRRCMYDSQGNWFDY